MLYEEILKPVSFELNYQTSLVKIDGKTTSAVNVLPADKNVENKISLMVSVGDIVNKILK